MMTQQNIMGFDTAPLVGFVAHLLISVSPSPFANLFHLMVSRSTFYFGTE